MFSASLEVPSGNVTHVVQVMSSAVATLQSGETREGVIIDIDTMKASINLTPAAFLIELPGILELLHESNKIMFFDCLRPTTLASLEPIYG